MTELETDRDAYTVERRRRQAGRNKVLGLILAALAILFFAITVVRIGDN